MNKKMKRCKVKKNAFYLILVIIFGISFNCFAVENANDLNLYSFGIKAGISYPQSNTSNFTDPIWFSTNANIGFSGGLNANYYLIKNILAIQLEADYILINASDKFTNWDMYGSPSLIVGNYSWHTLEIPLLLKISIPLNMPLKPFIDCGPALDIQLKNTISTSGYNTISGKLTLRGSLIAGIGTDYVLENGHTINLEARSYFRMLGQIKGYMGILPYTFFTVLLGYSI